MPTIWNRGVTLATEEGHGPATSGSDTGTQCATRSFGCCGERSFGWCTHCWGCAPRQASPAITITYTYIYGPLYSYHVKNISEIHTYTHIYTYTQLHTHTHILIHRKKNKPIYRKTYTHVNPGGWGSRSSDFGVGVVAWVEEVVLNRIVTM